MGSAFEVLAIIQMLYIHNFRALTYLYTFLFAFGSGIIHITSLQILWEHYIIHRGEISGWVFFCSWLGSYVVTASISELADTLSNGIVYNKKLDKYIAEIDTEEG